MEEKWIMQQRFVQQCLLSSSEMKAAPVHGGVAPREKPQHMELLWDVSQMFSPHKCITLYCEEDEWKAAHAAGAVIKMPRQGLPCTTPPPSPSPPIRPLTLLAPINGPLVFNHVEMIYLNVRQCVTSLPFISQNVCVLCRMMDLSSDDSNMTN